MTQWLPSRRGREAILLIIALGLASLLSGCGIPGTIATGGHLEQAASVSTPSSLSAVQFPQDEAPHHDLTEWWYYTGHFQGQGSDGKMHDYGFELTFFQTLRGAFSPYYAAHFAVSDLGAGQFHFDQLAGFEPASVIPASGSRSGFDISLGGWNMHGLNGHDHLSASMSNYAISFQLTATKPVVLHGGDGLISYGSAGFSYYYSRTRMSLAGTLTDHGARMSVSGQAWMDHQWGNFVSLLGSGWDWYSIQLDNNTEFMLYVIRDSRHQPITTFGTYVASDGSATEINASSIRTRALSTWTSPHTGGVYPSGWEVTITSDSTGIVILTLMPQLMDQELLTAESTGNVYWEGAVRISGSLGARPIAGLGYVELTGYVNPPAGSQNPALL